MFYSSVGVCRTMLLFKVFRTLLVLGLVMPLDAGGKGHAVSVKLDHTVRRQKETIVRLILDQKLLTPIFSASPIANISLSPWTYRDTCEVSRFPRHISQARCLTSGCLSLQGGGGEDMSLESKPIYYQALVLHRVLTGAVGEDKSRWRKSGVKASWSMNKKAKVRRQRYAFRLGTEIIAVGCTCVRPSTLPQK